MKYRLRDDVDITCLQLVKGKEEDFLRFLDQFVYIPCVLAPKMGLYPKKWEFFIESLLENGLLLNNNQKVYYGDWVVKFGSSVYCVFTDEDFKMLFCAVD